MRIGFVSDLFHRFPILTKQDENYTKKNDLNIKF